ncbi:SPOR domain-containing protein [uncultured Bacteroides sp.]|uniref:SPOR domain-containing protein n=1 Tax=uncultured Bacteroides sp. TaxID=162156 RepID=UPI002AAC0DF8|nr:SPOR domain-containing protein [uncultured Bacteroides sp.]
MKKLAVLGTGLCIVLAFTSCKSGESAYKKAYEKAKQQELAEPKVTEPVEVAPVADVPIVKKSTTTASANNGVRQERVTVQGNGTLLDYSVVCGSFQTKANAEALQEDMISAGYKSVIALNPDTNMYRVIISTFADRNSAAEARDAFKAKYPNRKDFQGAWILHRVF